jgi:hypothetical protein
LLLLWLRLWLLRLGARAAGTAIAVTITVACAGTLVGVTRGAVIVHCGCGGAAGSGASSDRVTRVRHAATRRARLVLVERLLLLLPPLLVFVLFITVASPPRRVQRRGVLLGAAVLRRRERDGGERVQRQRHERLAAP